MNNHNQIEQFIGECKVKGLSVTPQRLAIYKALVNDTSHPNPEKIYDTIKIDNPTITLATVYKNLETFEQNGLISMVTNLHKNVRYDPIVKQHHHIICVKCKKVVDLVDDELDSIKIPKDVLKNNAIIGHSVHFNVVCSECKNQNLKE
jgi:Fur family peroxide stress response transcriptional regulator